MDFSCFTPFGRQATSDPAEPYGYITGYDMLNLLRTVAACAFGVRIVVTVVAVDRVRAGMHIAELPGVVANHEAIRANGSVRRRVEVFRLRTP